MELRLSDLRYREVICVSTGERLGYVTDAVIAPESGYLPWPAADEE